MEELKVHIQHVKLWESGNNKNNTVTAKKISSDYGLGVWNLFFPVLLWW